MRSFFKINHVHRVQERITVIHTTLLRVCGLLVSHSWFVIKYLTVTTNALPLHGNRNAYVYFYSYSLMRAIEYAFLPLPTS